MCGCARGIGAYGDEDDPAGSDVFGGVVAEAAAEVSQRDGAVARKNLSLSRCARSSCSWGLRGRVRPRLRPGVVVV